MTAEKPGALDREKALDRVMARHQYSGDALIEVLHAAQELYGFLSPSLLKKIAHKLRLPPSRVAGVVTFYHYFSLKPPGKHTVTVCAGTACYIKGADQLIEAAEKRLGIEHGQTTKDGNISLMTARCVGACSRAPVVLCDGEVAGEASMEQVLEQLERWTVE